MRGMTALRTRLTDDMIAALARHGFGLVDGLPDLPARELEDAEGVLVATREEDRLVIRTIPRWRSPVDVRAALAERGWTAPATWVGSPPEDGTTLPAQLLVLLPVAGTAVDSAAVSAAGAAWATMPGERVVVPVPVTPDAPEVGWVQLADAYGGRLVGDRVEPARVRTGGAVVVFTGLSGAGKSTIAGRLVELLSEAGVTVTLLDGDDVRAHLSAGLGFSRADRDTNVRRIGWVAARIAKHGGIAVCAPIAPYAATREEVRRLVEAEAGPGSFLLVHVATPLDECEARDRKGLYARARRGEIAEFTGISDPYEPPADATLTIDTRSVGVQDSAQLVLTELVRAGLVERGRAASG